jgi:DNA-directed RNA polymerase subunit RPC12/RpoP
MVCIKCGKPLGTFIETAYGEHRCEGCYDDYLMTDKGKVEYLISFVSGELDMKDYDADFLGHVAVCWVKYRDEINRTLKDLYEIEAKAKCLGLL